MPPIDTIADYHQALKSLDPEVADRLRKRQDKVAAKSRRATGSTASRRRAHARRARRLAAPSSSNDES